MQEKQIRPLLAPSCGVRSSTSIHALLMFINEAQKELAEKKRAMEDGKRPGPYSFQPFDRLQSGCLCDGSYSGTSPAMRIAVSDPGVCWFGEV